MRSVPPAGSGRYPDLAVESAIKMVQQLRAWSGRFDGSANDMSDLVAALRGFVAHDAVTPGDAIDPRYLGDWLLHDEAVRPAAVVRPATTGEVSAILKLCSARCVPVVAQGGRTGLAGGAMPRDGSVILSLERMHAIEAVDGDAATIVVQAGAVLQAVQEAAANAGMLFPLDIGARGSCTIGGNISTNAGGNRVLRYGMMRNLVLGLEVVLANGTVIDAMNHMLKDNAGYDLKQLFIGSEGTLGVVTRAVLRLFPLTTSVQTALCAVGDYDGALALLRLARERLGADLSAYEVMWEDFYRLGTSGAGRRAPVAEGHRLYVLVESMGTDAVRDGERFEALIENAFGCGIVEDAVIARSLKETQEIWAVRDSSGELERSLGTYVPFDVSLPIRSIGRFVEDCRRRLADRWPGMTTAWFGHIADCNIHICAATRNGPADTHKLDELVYDCVAEYRGSISAEHGIGLLKREFLDRSRTPEAIAAMRLLKEALDPNAILNPGKIFV
jgi:FAD/FMN-containing dehydrogenase